MMACGPGVGGKYETREDELEAELAELKSRRCETCDQLYFDEPCDRFSPEFRAFIRDFCEDRPLYCCFWSERSWT